MCNIIQILEEIILDMTVLFFAISASSHDCMHMICYLPNEEPNG